LKLVEQYPTRPLARARIAAMLATLSLGLAFLAACAPGAAVLAPPTFQVDSARSGFISIDPPGIGDGSALFRLALTVSNPNPVSVRLSGLDGTLFLRETRAATTSFRGGIDLPANKSAPLVLDVRVPLGAAPVLLDTIANYVAGNTTSYRFDAAVTIDVFGAPQRFPAFTVAKGELPRPSGLVAPRFTLLTSALRFEAVNRVAVTLTGELTNSGLIGFFVQVPELVLSVGGAQAAVATLESVAVPGGGVAPVTLTFRFDPLALGAAVAAQVQAASAGVGGLGVQLNGGWRLEAPGIATTSLEPTAILRDMLR